MTEYSTIVGVAIFAALIILTFMVHDTFFGKEKDPHETIRGITLDAVFIAIIMIMTFVPSMGYIPVTPFVSLTLLHIPVLFGAALGGWKKGLLYGFVFGLSSYMQALSSAGFNALFAFPWVAIPPRAIFGLAAGIAFSLIGKVAQKKRVALYLAVACAVLTAMHTVLVFLDLYVFFPDTIAGLFTSGDPIATGTALTFTLVILFGMLGEMALATLVVPPLYFAVGKVRPRLIRKSKKR